ncbi:hypothetical protein BJ138DRAFT_1120663 [Hygrophoropsis aurantiaca]|uniref:Uncharacterized protein n=1 Tax=Hygrophoropsis aurantiaca TaxID=72124 RepID=A0ACB7ZR34_9AGAM|nr:hypothetical protein BJ138DRAFT_1120663 [Hygrophoropsis aurantiaca]
MVRPTIHKTPAAKLEASKAKRRNYYYREAINEGRRKHCAKRARAESVEEEDRSNVVEGGSDDDDELSDLSSLADCIATVTYAKDELLELVGSPRAFVSTVLQEFIATMYDTDVDSMEDDNSDGDLSVIEGAIASVETIHEKGHKGQARIYETWGVCAEWYAADEVCKGMRFVITMLEDLLCYAMLGASDLAEAHMLGELMYQKLDYNV